MSNTALVPVFSGTINNAPFLLCNARELHKFLQVGRRFATWITERISEYGFVENQDFIAISQKREIGNGRGKTDYHLTIGTAKELAMVERNDRGREVRRYFIECERKMMEGPSIIFRALLTDGGKDIVVPIPESVKEAVKKKALEMTLEAHEIIEEHIYRHAVGNAQYDPDNPCLNESMALYYIEKCSLNRAFAFEWTTRIRLMKALTEDVQRFGQYAQEKMDEVIEKSGIRLS